MVPRSLSMAVSQVSLLVVTFFASTLASGSLSIFTFAGNLQAVILGMFGVAFSLAVFPALSRLAAEGDEEQFFRLLVRTFRRILFFVIPLSVLMIVLRAQIVRVILGSGQFNWEDTILTFQVLGILAISLFAQSLVQLLARAFFALQNTWKPLGVAVASEVIQIGVLIALIDRWNIYALALAFVGANILNFFLLYVFLRQRLRVVWRDSALLRPTGYILCASAGAGLAAQWAKTWFGFNLSPLDTFWSVFAQASVTTLVAVIVFTLLSLWMKIEEFENLIIFLRTKIIGRPASLVETQSALERTGS
jgi:putative peptidoglycan lipid II flippase